MTIDSKISAAWSAFQEEYNAFGGHRYHGWDRKDDPRNYRGPRFWTEGDCALRFALHLEREFPGQVHLEMPVADWTFSYYDKLVDKRQFIDIVVTDLDDFAEDEASQGRFRALRHTLFVEVKFFPAGCSRTWRYDHVRKVPSVVADALRLHHHRARGHCERAAILVIDDDGLFVSLMAEHEWPTDVLQLIAVGSAET